MSSCIFCLIAQKTVPSQVVYEDDYLLAFNDLNPQAPIHILIIPKSHVANLSDVAPVDSEILGRLLATAAAIAAQKDIVADGYRVVINTGDDGGQTVAHLHLHLLGGRHLTWPPG